MNISVDPRGASERQRLLSGLCLLVAPAIGLAAEVLRYGGVSAYFTSGVLAVISMALVPQVLLAHRHLLRERAPRLAVYGCGLAFTFAMAGPAIIATYLVTEITSPAGATTGASIDEAVLTRLFPLFFLPGLLYMITRAVLGVGLWRVRAVPAWVGLTLAFGYLLTPIGRIPMIPPVVYLAGVLVLAAEAWLGWKLLTSRAPWAGEPVP